MVSSSETICEYFISYKGDGHKMKPFRMMLPKASAYVKMMEKLHGCIFLSKMMNY